MKTRGARSHRVRIQSWPPKMGFSPAAAPKNLRSFPKRGVSQIIIHLLRGFSMKLTESVHIIQLYWGSHMNAGWWFGTSILFSHILGFSSSQLTNSYFSEGFKPTTNQEWKTPSRPQVFVIPLCARALGRCFLSRARLGCQPGLTRAWVRRLLLGGTIEVSEDAQKIQWELW